MSFRTISLASFDHKPNVVRLCGSEDAAYLDESISRGPRRLGLVSGTRRSARLA